LLLKSLDNYLSVNHARLLSLWHTVGTLRRQFSDLKTTTDRELATLHAEFGRIRLAMNSACLGIRSQMHNAQLKHQVLSLQSAFTQCHCTVHRSNIRFPILDLLLHSVSAQCIAQTSGSQSSICFYTVSVHSAQLKHLVLNPVSAFMQCHCMKHLHCLCYSVCLHVIEFLFIAPLLYFTNTHVDITHTPI